MTDQIRQNMNAENFDDDGNPILDESDMQRVHEYLSSPIHQIVRKPFKPAYFCLLTLTSVTALLGSALVVTWMAGIPGAYLTEFFGPY
ncbi:MAG: DUF3094 family protein [Sinobacterium sp.]|nr:DUF3094 family protein [Sinobacterium sp.]